MLRKLTFLNWMTIVIFAAALFLIVISSRRLYHRHYLCSTIFHRSVVVNGFREVYPLVISRPIVGVSKGILIHNNLKTAGWAFFYLDGDGAVNYVVVNDYHLKMDKADINAPIRWLTPHQVRQEQLSMPYLSIRFYEHQGFRPTGVDIVLDECSIDIVRYGHINDKWTMKTLSQEERQVVEDVLSNFPETFYTN